SLLRPECSKEHRSRPGFDRAVRRADSRPRAHDRPGSQTPRCRCLPPAALRAWHRQDSGAHDPLEIHDITRFDRVQEFPSYARLVRPRKESGGKVLGTSGAKMGNVHLKWAFSEAAVTFLRQNRLGPAAARARLEKRLGKGKALSILAHKIRRAVYYMLAR